MHITESFCYTPESNTTLKINYTSVLKKEPGNLCFPTLKSAMLWALETLAQTHTFGNNSLQEACGGQASGSHTLAKQHTLCSPQIACGPKRPWRVPHARSADCRKRTYANVTGARLKTKQK